MSTAVLDPLPPGPPIEDDDGPLVRRKKRIETAELDIAPLIDITFLLLIFFLVASHPDIQSALALPHARHGQGVSSRNATIVTVAARNDEGDALIYLGDGKAGQALPADPQLASEAITRFVEDGLTAGKIDVLIKAERGVRHREVARVAAAAGGVEGVALYFAVLESD